MIYKVSAVEFLGKKNVYIYIYIFKFTTYLTHEAYCGLTHFFKDKCM